MPKPDYAYWDRQQEIERMDAAFLCCDFEPEKHTEDHPAFRRTLAMVRRLDEEVPCIRRGGSSDPRVLCFPETTFRYDALRQWAEKTGQRAHMPFLFPEDRGSLTTDTQGAESMGTVTKEGYLFLIGLLVQTFADSAKNLRNLNGEPNQSELLRQLEQKAKALMVSMDGLGKTQFNEKVSAALLEVKNRQPMKNPHR